LAYRRAGQLDKAVADYSKAVAEDPSLAKAYYERGSLAFEAGRYGPAIGDYISAAQAWIFDS
jgi:tetratricopeptide (TPR) repeat protein